MDGWDDFTACDTAAYNHSTLFFLYLTEDIGQACQP